MSALIKEKEHFNQHHEQTYAGSWAQMHILFRSVKKIIVKYYVMEMDKIVAERIYSESMAIWWLSFSSI